jgi:hypothetical protein
MPRNTRFPVRSTLGVALAAATSALVTAQQTPPAQPPAADPDLVFEREVFRYPTFQRRNPFKALVGDDAGPRYEQMELRAIIHDPRSPNTSVALVALRRMVQQQVERTLQQQVQQQQQAAVPQQDTIYVPDLAQRLRVGQSWGNVRVVQIAADHVVVDVSEFGIVEQRIMRMPVQIQRPGGPS